MHFCLTLDLGRHEPSAVGGSHVGLLLVHAMGEVAGHCGARCQVRIVFVHRSVQLLLRRLQVKAIAGRVVGPLPVSVADKRLWPGELLVVAWLLIEVGVRVDTLH